MIHKLLLFLCRSTRSSRCSFLGIFPYAWMEMKETEERGGRQGDGGRAYTRLWCGYRNWLVEGVSVLPKDISHTPEEEEEREALSCLV